MYKQQYAAAIPITPFKFVPAYSCPGRANTVVYRYRITVTCRLQHCHTYVSQMFTTYLLQ